MTVPRFLRIAPLLVAALGALATPPSARAEDGGVTQIDQVGAGNEATIQQKYVASGGLADAQNRATVSQDGTGNAVGITQEGASLTATVTQNGDDLSATIGQSGASHNATVEQYGSGHEATVQQSGTSPHEITIQQDNMYGGAGQTVTVQQSN